MVTNNLEFHFIKRATWSLCKLITVYKYMIKHFIFLICHLYTGIFYNILRKNWRTFDILGGFSKIAPFRSKIVRFEKKLNWCAPNSTRYMEMIITHFRQKMHFGPFSKRVPHITRRNMFKLRDGLEPAPLVNKARHIPLCRGAGYVSV